MPKGTEPRGAGSSARHCLAGTRITLLVELDSRLSVSIGMASVLATQILKRRPLHVAVEAVATEAESCYAGTKITDVFFTAEEAAHAVLRAQTVWLEKRKRQYYPQNRIHRLRISGPEAWRDVWAHSSIPAEARVELWQPYGDQISVSHCNLDLYLKKQVLDLQLSASEVDAWVADCCSRAQAGTATNLLSSIMAPSAVTFKGYQTEFSPRWMTAQDRDVGPAFAELMSWQLRHGYAMEDID